MAKVTVRVIGVDKLIRELEKMGLDASGACKTAVRAGAEIVVREANQEAPQDTGKLAASVRISSVRNYKHGARATVRPRLRYGYYQEKGTEHHRAQPFMGPAAENSQHRVGQAAENVFRQALKG